MRFHRKLQRDQKRTEEAQFRTFRESWLRDRTAKGEPIPATMQRPTLERVNAYLAQNPAK